MAPRYPLRLRRFPRPFASSTPSVGPLAVAGGFIPLIGTIPSPARSGLPMYSSPSNTRNGRLGGALPTRDGVQKKQNPARNASLIIDILVGPREALNHLQ